ncbi:FKBP-type peptidyl-prolyl cis-trans isomerase domain containing protein [Fimbriimonadaceae bacterium]
MLATVAAIAMMSAEKMVVKDVKVGSGQAAQALDFVVVDYTGTLTNGKKFDSSIGRAPFRFRLGVGQVIEGWDKGVAGMKVGGKRSLRIPPEMGYRDQAQGDIPANSTLLFDVTLKAIERATFKVTKKGSGPAAVVGSDVKIHYKGTLKGGKQFDSSYTRGEPIAVKLGAQQVIPGFEQGILGMRKGEKRTVTIPPTLGYGSQGAGGVIPPDATLVFELEAVEIK